MIMGPLLLGQHQSHDHVRVGGKGDLAQGRADTAAMGAVIMRLVGLKAHQVLDHSRAYRAAVPVRAP
jgi:hypothetical protein